MATQTKTRPLAQRETSNLIGSDKGRNASLPDKWGRGGPNRTRDDR
jgi:hypothetical protein